MQAERLSDIKKELKALGTPEIIEICLKLAKYKKENKELLSYLLFHSSDSGSYISSVKTFLQENFQQLSSSPYQRAKELRKILRLLNKHIKFIGSAEAEVDLLLWYSASFVAFSGVRSSQKTMITMLTRLMIRISKQIQKLHEDLQFDYKQEYDNLLASVSSKIRGINVHDLKL